MKIKHPKNQELMETYLEHGGTGVITHIVTYDRAKQNFVLYKVDKAGSTTKIKSSKTTDFEEVSWENLMKGH